MAYKRLRPQLSADVAGPVTRPAIVRPLSRPRRQSGAALLMQTDSSLQALANAVSRELAHERRYAEQPVVQSPPRLRRWLRAIAVACLAAALITVALTRLATPDGSEGSVAPPPAPAAPVEVTAPPAAPSDPVPARLTMPAIPPGADRTKPYVSPRTIAPPLAGQPMLSEDFTPPAPDGSPPPKIFTSNASPDT